MFKRELKVNFKSFVIWLLVLIGIFLVGFLIYPSIMSSDNIQMMDEMMSVFPEEMLIAFNMDIASINSVYGWIKSEGFVFVLLIIGCYSGLMGSNILLKEESEKTIEYLNSLPIKRNTIILKKTIVGLIYICLMILLLGIFNYVGLTLSGEFDQKQYILLSITPLFSSIVIYFLCMLLSTFTHKSKQILGISFGIVLVSYVFQMLSAMADSTKFLKYFSVFSLADIRNVIITSSIDLKIVLLSLVLSIVLFLITVVKYNKKELI